MSVIALQIGADGYSWCRLPEVLHADQPGLVQEYRPPWPAHPEVWSEGELPRAFILRLLAHHDILALLDDADEVLYAVEPSTDQRLAGVVDVAVVNYGWSAATVVGPHPDGAAGIIREHIEELLRASDPVPQEDLPFGPDGEARR
jgi:hypothetical protein